MKTGASVGAILSGYISQIVGRRRTIIISVMLSGLLIPAWILPAGEGQLSASGFFIQLLIQGSWGVVPIHLNELSPAAFRSTFPGKQCRIHLALETAPDLNPYRCYIPNRQHDFFAFCTDCQRNSRKQVNHKRTRPQGPSIWPHNGCGNCHYYCRCRHYCCSWI